MPAAGPIPFRVLKAAAICADNNGSVCRREQRAAVFNSVVQDDLSKDHYWKDDSSNNRRPRIAYAPVPTAQGEAS
jgi:hypothetical protein